MWRVSVVPGKRILICLLAIGVLTLAPLPAVADAEGPVTVLRTAANSTFREGIHFQITASTREGQIVMADLLYRAVGSSGSTRAKADFNPDQMVFATYFWDTSKANLAPDAPIEYWWELRDAAGNAFSTEPARVRYLDTRFTWDGPG